MVVSITKITFPLIVVYVFRISCFEFDLTDEIRQNFVKSIQLLKTTVKINAFIIKSIIKSRLDKVISLKFLVFPLVLLNL